MKLDSIVYDYGTLQSAIATALNTGSPTFNAIYPSDTATSLVNVLASYGSMLQYQLVSAMANMYTDSAYSEAGIYQLAETLGNRLHGNISSRLYCDMTRENLKGVNITIPAGTKFTVEDLNFFNPETIVFPLSANTINRVELIQGIKLVSEQIASGISGEKIYFCEDFKCNTDRVEVYVNGESWDITNSFLPYVVTDTSISNRSQAVILKTDPDGRTYIKFGNNTNGRIPEKGSVIRIEYISNEGANGNLNNNNLEIKLSTPIYYTNTANTREKLEVKITAVSTASGGFNTQSLEVLKQSSPYVFGSGQRAVRRNDYKSMLLNKCGYLTCNVWGEYEEAAIQGGYDKIMMNMVYYTGIKVIQKYDLQPVRSLEIDPVDIATTKYAIVVKEDAISTSGINYAGWYLKKLPADTAIPLSIDNIKKDYSDSDDTIITFPTKDEAEAYIKQYQLDNEEALKYNNDPDKFTSFISFWLDNPADPKRPNTTYYPVAGSIEGARGFLGSYVIDIASYDINNIPVSVKYRDKQGTGILTCDPSINRGLSDFEETVYPANDLLKDVHATPTGNAFNFKITSNQQVDSDLTEILVKEDKDYTTTGLDARGQPFVITFNNPYQLRIEFTDAPRAVGAFAFKTPSNEKDYKNFMHQFAIYGTKTANPDYNNIKNSEDWDKLSGMYTFDEEIATDHYSDWVTTNVYNPDNVTTEEEDITSTRDIITDPTSEYYNKITYTTRLIGSTDYVYNLKVNGKTILPKNYKINNETGVIIFLNDEPAEDANVMLYATTYKWTAYKHYVIEIYAIHDTSQLSPQKVAFKQIKALYKDSVSTIDYTNNNAFNLNIPIRVAEENTKTICLPTDMEYYEYSVSLNNITEANQYRNGDILRWSTTIDNTPYTFIINIINIMAQQYNISLQDKTGLISSNLRGKNNLMVTNDTLDASTSTTRGSGGTISIASTSTINVYGSYTGNFYTNADIQSADLPTLNKYNHFTTYIEFKQPLIKNVTIEANVEYENVTNYQTVRNNVIAAVNKLFELQPYSIGSTLNVSDIWKAINDVEGVKRFNVITPLNNIDTLPYELLMLPAENLIINDIINSEYK